MFSKSSAVNQGDEKRVYLVYLVCLVYLVGRTGNPTGRIKETGETR